MKTPFRWVLPALLLAGVATVASAQTRPHLGPRFGVNFDSDDALVGIHLTTPIVRRLEFYPSFDVYLPDNGSSFGFNADLKVLFPTRRAPQFYAGGGLNLLHRSVNGTSRSDAGLNLIGGIESRRGQWHPFAEGRILVHDNSAFQLVIGFNITMGGHH